MPSETLTKEEWLARLKPALDESTRAASRAMTNAAPIQSWLHDHALEAAMSLQGESDMEAATQAYGRLMDELQERFPALFEAVREVTGGCGRIGLNWRPLAPDYTTLYIDFGRDFDVKVFYEMEEATETEAGRALERVCKALPKGEPFPKRPNTSTGIVACRGQCLGVRFLDALTGQEDRRRSVTLFPKAQPPLEGLSEEEAQRRMVDLLQEQSDQKWWEQRL